MPDSCVSSLTTAPSVAFDAGQLTSDGGLVWLAQADDRLGLSASFSAQIRDWRRGPVRHALVLVLLLRQRAWRMPSTGAPVIAWLTPRIHSRDKIGLVSPP